MIVRHTSSPRRSGVILLVVMSLLALFAALGLAFVYYADSESATSTNSVAAATAQIDDVDPEMLLAFYLNQLIYGVGDAYAQNGTLLSPYAASSAMRGHDLARNMFGYNVLGNNPATYPYNGVGKMPPKNGGSQAPFQFTTPSGQNVPFISTPNMTYYPADGFIIDPERWGPVRSGPGQPLTAPYVGWNVPYTYPDQNNLFLGTMNANGEILAPSWWRYWDAFALPGSIPMNPMDPANPFWNPAVSLPMYKYMTLRPHPSAHPYFPPPADGGGDVKCVDVGPGLRNPGVPAGQPNSYFANESIWMDLGFPVLIGPNGRKYKPLFASFVTDMDSKINVNVHGNVRANGSVHASNMGLGPWEVNPAWVLSGGDYANLFLGNNAAWGRYGASGVPDIAGAYASNIIGAQTGALPNSLAPSFQLALDLEGVYANGNLSNKYILPGEFNSANSPYFGFVGYATPNSPNYGTFGNSPLYGNTGNTLAQLELLGHPSLFNVFNPGYTAPKSTNNVYPDSTVESLYRTLSTGSAAMTPRLFRVCPTSLGDPAGRTMRLLTTRSYDVGMPGAMPSLTGPGGYVMQQPAGPAVPPYPVGVATPFNPQPGGEFTPPTANGQMTNYAWSMLRKINLNRPLTAYPAPVASGGTGQIPITSITQYQQAVSDRQALAQDIFNVFVQTTMGVPLGPNNQPNWTAVGLPANPATLSVSNQPQYLAIQWLAQLSVNVVDYIDTDNYVTPFNWNPADPVNGWVYGTELPRLLLNEFYCEADNNPADLGLGKNKGKGKGPVATLPYHVNSWVELVNTITNDPNVVDVLTGATGAVRLQMPAGNGFNAYNIYALTITQGAASFTNSQLGTPNTSVFPGAGIGVPSTWPASPPAMSQPLVYPPQAPPNDYAGTGANTPGFYVMGPINPAIGANLRSTTMHFPLPAGTLPAAFGNNNYFLSRLACPDLPPQPIANPALWPSSQPYYNPYVTVDYATNVPVNDGLQLDLLGTHVPLLPVNQRQSMGRKQPLAASLIVPQNPIPASANQQTTFFRHNGREASNPSPATFGQTLTMPFNWLVHPDRQITSPVELLHVSQYPPYLLTQKFMGAGPPSPSEFGHTSMAAWFDSRARIFRAMEFFETGIRSPGIPATATANVNASTGQVTSVTVTSGGAGYSPTTPPTVSLSGGSGKGALGSATILLNTGGTGTVSSVTVTSGGSGYTPTSPPTVTIAPAHDVYGSSIPLTGRIPGRINLNTYWDHEILLALTDPQTNLSLFSPADVIALHKLLLSTRSPSHIPGPADRPFYGMAGNAVGTLGAAGPTVDDTFFRTHPGAPPPFPHSPGSRIFSIRPPVNVVTAANPAVPGVLNVNPTTPDSSFLKEGAPPFTKMELLSKIYNNATVRSNVFAVWLTVGFFDVTDGPLSDPSLVNDNNPAGAVTASKIVKNFGGSSTLTVPLTSGSVVGVPWKIAPGVTLWIGNSNNVEPVVVTSVPTATTFTVTFANNNHAAGEPIAMKGVLGQEVGIAGGSNVRHRMFAMVDRTALSIPNNLTTTGVNPIFGQTWSYMPAPPISLPQGMVGQPYVGATINVGLVNKATVTMLTGNGGLNVNNVLGTGIVTVIGTPASSGNIAFQVVITNAAGAIVSQNCYNIPVVGQASVQSLSGVSFLNYPAQSSPLAGPALAVNYAWQIQPGMTLVIGPDSQGNPAETIQVQSVNTANNTITAQFLQTHAANAPILLPGQPGVVPGSVMGNPGPQQRFDHRLNTALVPHYSVIK